MVRYVLLHHRYSEETYTANAGHVCRDDDWDWKGWESSLLKLWVVLCGAVGTSFALRAVQIFKNRSFLGGPPYRLGWHGSWGADVCLCTVVTALVLVIDVVLVTVHSWSRDHCKEPFFTIGVFCLCLCLSTYLCVVVVVIVYCCSQARALASVMPPPPLPQVL